MKRPDLRDLIDNFSGVIYTTDINGIIEFASAGVLGLTGYPPAEVTGRNFAFLVEPSNLDRVSRHYAAQFKNDIRETTIEFHIVTHDGKSKWVEQIAVLLQEDGRKTGFQCFVRDISEKKAMQVELEAFQARLKENRLLLASILDNAFSIIYVKDTSGRYLIANRRFLNLLGRSEAEVLGHTDFDLCSREDAIRYKSVDDRVMQTGRPLVVEERIDTAKGPITLLLTKFPLADKDKRIGIGGIALDISDRVARRQALMAAHEAANDAREEAEEARKAAEDARKMQEQFLANMSHEIRTPMNGIQGMTQLLLGTTLNAQQQEFVGHISHSVENLLVIINDILDFSKIKAGKLNIEKIDFRPADIIANVRALFAPRITKKKLSFETHLDPAIPEWLRGDPHRLSQELINLVGNAIKFTEKGTVRVTATLEETRSGSVTLGFSVSDEGIGIKQENIPYIFDSFVQAGPDISRKYGGTGLGLTISRQLLALQGGSIEVTSREGNGSTFHFHLPFDSRPKPASSKPAIGSIMNYEGLLQDLRVLVAEDNPINQQVTEHVLIKAGARVTIADNGEQAVDWLKKETFDLIIMDLQMPVMDGYEATRYLRNTLQLQTPVLAMTASAIKGERIRCLEVGMSDYMSKPFEFRDFYQRVVRLLNLPAAY